MKKSYDSKFKSRVALAALRDDKTIAEIAGEFQVHPNHVLQWKKKLVEGAGGVFQTKSERKAENKGWNMWLIPSAKSRLETRIETRKIVSRDGDACHVSDRQTLIPGFNQAALEKARIILVGGGGIGSEVAEGLARKGVGNLAIYDHDVVELSNLNRQHFFACDIGCHKGVRLAKNIARHATCGSVFSGYGYSIQDAIALEHDLRADAVVCGVDNNFARVETSRFFRKLNIPVVFIAVD